ncbi:hemin receptor [Aquincola sp. S2]|uniref:Hemin receptor n=1 Tax=Pseudaquabacterium terrae TaxID=2732868 RepID=A0ABX2EBR1_9BURK|nr:globin domain-containing protein [Aquabacterium terrae]NRF66575.1 hemin receptor [Aquabacterium terrae]
MNPDQIHLVQASFARSKDGCTDLAARFYRRLFEIDPALRGLFHGDLQQQGQRLLQMLGAAVGLLARPETLFPVLQSLGNRHAGYGVRPEHYDAVATALIDTLAEVLGSGFTTELRDAWSRLIAIVRQEMLNAPVLAFE